MGPERAETKQSVNVVYFSLSPITVGEGSELNNGQHDKNQIHPSYSFPGKK